MNPSTSIQDKGTGGSVSIVEKESKRCKKCGVKRPINDFFMSSKNSAGKRYWQGTCKVCKQYMQNESRARKNFTYSINDLLRHWK